MIELAISDTGSRAIRPAPRRRHAARAAVLLATTALTSPLLIDAAIAQTLPTGGSVAAGSVSIAQPSATQLTVTQASQSAVVNFQSFSVGQGSSVTFAQPNASSAILNRVTGSTPSSIAGSITANGSVYLVNPNGIAITSTGTVNTGGGFVASTLGISDSDFMAGKRTFTGNGASASVSNAGTISVGRGGYAALIGGTVSNSGAINVPLGKVGLGSGEQATLDFSGDGFLQVAVPTASRGKGALIRNAGTINADGGRVIISAATAREAARNAINISGVVQARSISGHNGSISIGGGDGGRVRVTGRLDASSVTGHGGRIAVTGRDIKLKGAVVDASGATGGGTIEIGGGRQGQGPLQRARTTTIDSKTVIKADATNSGNGGNVVVWSDQSTNFAGNISARGGALWGNGGEAEVSGKAKLAYTGFADLSAPHGSFGNLLLDPYNVIISNGADTGGFTATANDSVINATTLSNQLGSASVTVTTGASGSPGSQDGNITVAAPVAWSAPTTLTLNAANAISINAPINVNGAGGVALTMANDTTTFAGFSIPKLSFGTGASIDYGATNNGGTLSINGQSYALVYDMAGLAGLNTSGRSALATSLFATSDGTANGTPTAYTSSVITGAFSGTFEGLGHTISNLTITDTTSPQVGLFRYMGSGTIRDIGLVGGSITGGNSAQIGALVGYVGLGSAQAAVVNVWSSANVTGGDGAAVGGLIGRVQSGNGTPTLVANSSSTGNVTTGAQTGSTAYAGGLVGYHYAPNNANATVSGSYATGTVTGGSNAAIGGLVGTNDSNPNGRAAIVNSYATGAVTGTSAGNVGGLVGSNVTNAGVSSIAGSFATGAVKGGANANGGLVGSNTGGGTNGVGSITDSFATGAVTGRAAGFNGGLVGWNLANGSGAVASITTSYATGGVSTTGYGGTAGLIGRNQAVSGTTSIASAYWDISTSGSPTLGIGNDTNGQSANVTGLTTAQFQSGSLPSGFSSGVWATGAGLYPYQKALFANGVQAVSGFVYSDAGATALASGTNGAVTVDVIANGRSFANATTGANGYYYAFAGTPIAANQSVLAYLVGNAVTGAINSATLTAASGASPQSGVNLFGNTLKGPVSDTTLSAASASIVTNANAAANGNSAALMSISGTSDRSYIASGPSFTIDQTVSTSGLFGVQTTAPGAGITVAAGSPITIGSGGRLILDAAGALAINAPVNLNGAVTASLAAGFDTTTAQGVSLLDLSFGNGASLAFNKADGTAASASQGGTLAVNGNAYSLIYSISDLDAINSNLGGRHALATDLDASGNSYTGAVIAPGRPFNAPLFSGTLEGLGHAIANLSIANTADLVSVGLVGLNAGTIRDLKLVGGSVATTGIANATGALVGYNQGVVANVASSAAVRGGTRADQIGGLVGFSDGSSRHVAIVGSSSTGAVSIASGTVGGLVGLQQGRNGFTATIANSFATGAVSADFSDTAGGLVGVSQGVDGGTAAITNSYATGNVAIGGQFSAAGGLVGSNSAVRGGVASLTNVYATGVVSASGSQATAGGLVGTNSAYFGGAVTSITNAYSTGVVQTGAQGKVGGLVGNNFTYDDGSPPPPVTSFVNAYWDTQTSGRSNAFGADNTGASATGLTTRQLQGFDPVNGNAFSVATNLGNGTTSAFAGGAAGLYPYLKSFFPNGVQVISGTAYSDAGLTPAAPRTIGVIGGGMPFASVSSGANGYYYAVGAPGTIATNATLLAHDGVNAATLTTKDGAIIQSVDLYGRALTVPTTATTLSTAPDLANARTTALAAAGGNAAATTAINAASGQGFIATGTSFTIDTPVTVSDTFVVQTKAGAALTVAAGNPINVQPGGSLALLSGGSLAVNAPVTVRGAAGVNLSYDASNPTNLSFGLTGSGFTSSLTYQSSAGGALTSGAGGALAINGQRSTLLYNISDLAAVNTTGLAGNYAVATNIDATGVSGFVPIGGDGLYYTGAFNGLGHSISNLTIEKSSGSVGLFGWVGVGGSVANVGLVNGTVTGGGAAYVGALVGYNKGAIAQSYTTDAVIGGDSAIVGGLVGYNEQQGTITQSFTTGPVTVGQSGNAGGLVGFNYYGTVANAYATGAVTGGANASVGGFASFNGGTIVNAYATGAVSAGGNNAIAAGFVAQNNSGIFYSYATGAVSATGIVGGFVGSNNGGFTNSYWDTQTSGRTNAIGVNYNNSSGTVLGLTTGQLQGIDTIPSFGGRTFSVLTDLGDGTNTAFAGGFDGNYPYLARFFPNGVQVISGYAYNDAGSTPATPRTIGVIGGGTPFASASSGANGYYYAFGAPGTIATNATLLVHNGVDAATLTAKDGAIIQNVDLYGNTLIAPTSQITLSAAATDVVQSANAAAGTNAAALTAIAGSTDRFYNATGASFTIDQPVATSRVFGVRTQSGAPLTVSNPITIGDGGSLALLSGGALAINAPLTANGAVAVSLAYDASSPTNLSFELTAAGFTGGLIYRKADGTAAASSLGGTLAINNQNYTLLYNLGSVGASNAIQDIDTLGLSGFYALATNLNGAGTTFTSALAGAKSPYSNTGAFAGTFEGLGHTITGLTIANPMDYFDVGLFGSNTGTIRDIGIISGRVSGTGYAQNLGMVAGRSYGDNSSAIVANVYATGTVSSSGGSGNIGGLVGGSYSGSGPASIVNSFASVAVSGGQGANVGGLAGSSRGVIATSYATGSATISLYGTVGGLVGQQSGGSIADSYATGAVIGGEDSKAGGLIGLQAIYNDAASVSNVYATGVVVGSGQYANVGGLIGQSFVFGTGSMTIANAYWDKTTSNRANGIGRDQVGQSGNIVGLTTTQLQTFGAAAVLGPAFAGGPGLYPYLVSFAPNGMQAFTGTAYRDAGLTPLASNANGAVTIGLVADGTRIGQATTGANGYYYIATALSAPFTPAVNNGQNLLAYTLAPTAPAARLDLASGGLLQIGLNLYGNALTVPTNAALFSQGPQTASDARIMSQSTLAAAAGSNTDATAAINGAAGLGLIATGGSFAIDRTPTINALLAIESCGCTAIGVTAPITVAAGQSLGLLSGGTLAINAPITVNGAGSVALGYDPSASGNLSFGLTGSGFTGGLTFANADGTAATSSQSGALAINGRSYKLLYNLASNGTDAIQDIDALGLSGNYALATNVSGAGTTFTASLAGAGGYLAPFTGTFAGLGHSVSGLTIVNSVYQANLGLFGSNAGTIRDLGIVGGSVTGTGDYQNVGLLVGRNYNPSGTPTIANVFATGTARAIGITDTVGGLVGSNPNGAISNAFAAVTVSVVAPTGEFEAAGGLVGSNNGAIDKAYATGAVSISGYGDAGGLVGSNGGSITNAYATGAVSGGTDFNIGSPGNVGGLIGQNFTYQIAATISNVYATGAVSGNGATTGGLIGQSRAGGGGSLTLANAAWDTATTGQVNAFGADNTGQTATGFTTMQLQRNGLAALGFDPTLWRGATDGLYPYLTAFFPNGVQAVSGFAYQDAGVTPLISGANGAAYVSIAGNGQTLASVTTGANGYYYAILPSGTLAGTGVAAYTQANVATGATDAVSYVSGTPGVTTGLDISGGWRRDTVDASTATLSAFDTGFATATTGTPVAGFALANRQIGTTAAFAIDRALSVTGTLALDASDAVTQTAAIAASRLLLTGAGGAFTLTNNGNAIGALAADTGSATVKSNNALTVSAGLANAVSLTTSGVTTAGPVGIATTGDLTLATGARVIGANPVLAAGSAFINDAGASAVTATTGRWLIYSADPATNVFGGLDSGNMAVWNTAAGAPVAVAGNRYAFAANRTLTVTTLDDSKTYGDDITSRVATDYAITGGDAGLAGVYRASTASTAFTGKADVTSAGASATAGVAASPYAITASLGSLVSDTGYRFAYVNSGLLTVNPRSITVTADAQSRAFGDANPLLTYGVGGLGLVNGDTLTGGLTTDATAASPAGPYAITQGNLAASSNYSLTYRGALLSVQPVVQPPAQPVVQAPAAQNSPVIDPATLASGLVRDNIDWIALPSYAVPLSGAAPVLTPFGTGVFYSDPRFNRVLVCFGTGGTAPSCFTTGG